MHLHAADRFHGDGGVRPRCAGGLGRSDGGNRRDAAVEEQLRLGETNACERRLRCRLDGGRLARQQHGDSRDDGRRPLRRRAALGCRLWARRTSQGPAYRFLAGSRAQSPEPKAYEMGRPSGPQTSTDPRFSLRISGSILERSPTAITTRRSEPRYFFAIASACSEVTAFTCSA